MDTPNQWLMAVLAAALEHAHLLAQRRRWCAGLLICPPPHCPFDSKIIEYLGLNILWTHLDTMAEYEQLVEAGQALAGNMGLAMWELQLYNHL